jgi:hypothetical protein
LNAEYKRGFTLESFLNSTVAWPAEDQIGGWIVRGYSHKDEYDEYIIGHPVLTPADWERLCSFNEWIRHPIEKGTPLLERRDAGHAAPTPSVAKPQPRD